MAGAVGSDEIAIRLPWDDIDAGPGIAIDIGGSVIKLLYIKKDEYVKPGDRKKDSEGQLWLINVAREQLDEALEYMKKNAYIKRSHPDEAVKIYTTGIGGSQFGQRIKSELNVMSENIAETDCFIQSFMYLLKNVSRVDILCEIDRPLFEQAKEKNAKMIEMFKKFAAMTDTMQNMEIKEKPVLTYPQEDYVTIDKPLHEQESFYPCMLVMGGSGMGGMLVKEDGSCQAGVMMPMGGRMFLGLGSLLTRTKTYAELMELCEKGNAANVGITNLHLSQGWDTSAESNMYSTFTEFDETMVFSFGHAVGKTLEDFKKEDMARSLLDLVVRDLVQFTHLSCRELEAANVVFSGGFANHPLTRKLITQEWLGLDGTTSSVELKEGKKNRQGKIGIHFLKHGTHLGALGAYMNSKLHFNAKHGATST